LDTLAYTLLFALLSQERRRYTQLTLFALFALFLAARFFFLIFRNFLLKQVGELDLSKERAAQQERRMRKATAALASSSSMSAPRLLRGVSDPTECDNNSDEQKDNNDDGDEKTNEDGDDTAELDTEDASDPAATTTALAIRLNGTDAPRNNLLVVTDDADANNTAASAAAAAAESEMSRLEAEQIELLVNPELSESAGGVAHQLETAMARERDAKLAAAKSTADAEGVMVQACIFKVGDDVRQDALALQVIQWCKNIMQANGLDLFLYPYRVLPTRIGDEGIIGGVIECVPNASTRDEIGKATACSLKDYFISKFGPPSSAEFQRAQKNFITSAAAYAVCCWVLQVKDRHNGNVMIDQFGHVIHIDFGFIFDISPAKNMKFESAGFKLTLEMVRFRRAQLAQPFNSCSGVSLCARSHCLFLACFFDFALSVFVCVCRSN
jgi:hypothetical protein